MRLHFLAFCAFLTLFSTASIPAVEGLRNAVQEGAIVGGKAPLASAVARRRGSCEATTGSSSDAPTLFAPEKEWPAGSDASPAFTPDGRTVFFTHAVGATRTIMVASLRNGAWSKPATAPFSGTWRDIEPAMAPDGSYLVFISNRPATPGGEPLTGFFGGAPRPGAGGNIWRVNREGRGWGEPVRLPTIVNSQSAIYSPAVARDGSLYLNHPDPVTKKTRLYRAQATVDGFLEPVPVSFTDGIASDFDAVVAPDESFIVFSSNRAPSQPNMPMIFIAYAKKGQWTEPQILQPPTSGLEARLSPDLKTLYFSTDAPSSSPAKSTDPTTSRIFKRPLSLEAKRSDQPRERNRN
jgi:Tol biopolymer transport system component